jgi:hypothetical protein
MTLRELIIGNVARLLVSMDDSEKPVAFLGLEEYNINRYNELII